MPQRTQSVLVVVGRACALRASSREEHEHFRVLIRSPSRRGERYGGNVMRQQIDVIQTGKRRICFLRLRRRPKARSFAFAQDDARNLLGALGARDRESLLSRENRLITDESQR